MAQINEVGSPPYLLRLMQEDMVSKIVKNILDKARPEVEAAAREAVREIDARVIQERDMASRNLLTYFVIGDKKERITP